MMDHINVTRLQESLYDFYRMYNLSFALSIVTCPAFEANVKDNEDSRTDVLTSQEETDSDTLHSFIGLFSFFFEDGNNLSSINDEGQSQDVDCISVLDVSLNQRFSTYFDVCLVLTLACFLIWFVLSVIKCIFRRLLRKTVKNQELIASSNEKENDTKFEMESDIQNDKDIHDKVVIQPFKISFPFELNNGFVKNGIDQIFESTLPLFLKQLDSYLGFEIQHLIDERYVKPSSPTFTFSNTTFSDTALQSPRVRRKWSRPQDISPPILRNSYTNEKNLRNWMVFEAICKRLNWMQPRCLQSGFHLEHSKDGDESLNVLLNFLRQNCISKLVDWNLSVSIVNYSLFLLDQVMKLSSENDKSNEALRLIGFESVGSAADGTTAGKPSHFDVMFVFEFNQSTELNVLHNNYCDDISPGYVVLGVNNVDNKNILRSTNCLNKAQIQNKFGFFLLVNQIEDLVDGMVRKAVRKLNTNHKYKMEMFPFRLSMNSTRKLQLTIDTSIFNGTGIELFSISVNFIPSICIESSEFAFLPKLYAVPTIRSDHRKMWEEKEKRIGALSKLFPRTNNSRVPSNLLWNISVAKLQMDIRHSNVQRLHKSNTESCHEQCLMILKGLFSTKNNSSVQSNGEISSYVLSTVVDFLLMESSSSAWKMSRLRDRVSDAVHFLRSAYTNIWLPNFVIHNPHLAKKIPVLHSFSPILKGRQQNLLADVDANAAQKTIAYINSRLKETGLSKIINEEYSDEMWEYEFFLFG